MAVLQHSQERKIHAIIVIMKAEDGDLEISWYLKVVISFLFEVCKALETEDGNVTTVSKFKKHSKTLWNHQNTWIYLTSLADHWWKSQKINKVNYKRSQVSEGTIRNVVHEDIIYVLGDEESQFMSEKTKEKRLIWSKLS